VTPEPFEEGHLYRVRYRRERKPWARPKSNPGNGVFIGMYRGRRSLRVLGGEKGEPGGVSPPTAVLGEPRFLGIHPQQEGSVRRSRAYRNNTFLGVSCCQAHDDFWLWEEILNEENYGSITELGTGAGGFSFFLLAQCLARNMEFLTFDKAVSRGRWTHGWQGSTFGDSLLFPRFVACDIFKQAAMVSGAIERAKQPRILFCDDGDKRREVELFSPLLKPPELLVVHDWNNLGIFGPEDVPPGFEVLREGEMTVFLGAK
jgi:cephalosporin hydroxylase